MWAGSQFSISYSAAQSAHRDHDAIFNRSIRPGLVVLDHAKNALPHHVGVLSIKNHAADHFQRGGESMQGSQAGEVCRLSIQDFTALVRYRRWTIDAMWEESKHAGLAFSPQRATKPTRGNRIRLGADVGRTEAPKYGSLSGPGHALICREGDCRESRLAGQACRSFCSCDLKKRAIEGILAVSIPT